MHTAGQYIELGGAVLQLTTAVLGSCRGLRLYRRRRRQAPAPEGS